MQEKGRKIKISDLAVINGFYVEAVTRSSCPWYCSGVLFLVAVSSMAPRPRDTKTRAGRPLNKSPFPAEPRPRRPRHLADARAVAADLQRAARARRRLGRVAHARPSDRRREQKRRGGTTREGRLLTGSDAGTTLGPPPEHERVYI